MTSSIFSLHHSCKFMQILEHISSLGWISRGSHLRSDRMWERKWVAAKVVEVIFNKRNWISPMRSIFKRFSSYPDRKRLGGKRLLQFELAIENLTSFGVFSNLEVTVKTIKYIHFILPDPSGVFIPHKTQCSNERGANERLCFDVSEDAAPGDLLETFSMPQASFTPFLPSWFIVSIFG